MQGNGYGRGAARKRWLKLILLIPLRLQSGLGMGPAARVNGSRTGIETNDRFEGTCRIAGQSEKCVACCCFVLSQPRTPHNNFCVPGHMYSSQ